MKLSGGAGRFGWNRASDIAAAPPQLMLAPSGRMENIFAGGQVGKHLIIILFFIALNGCKNTDTSHKEDYTATAVEFFNGIYGCDSTVVDRLASPDVIITYPIFEKLFNTRVLRGQQVVRRFAAGFCSRWAEPQITIHRAISEGENVVLVWSFRARNVGSALPDTPPSNKIESWGGITLFQFDENGKVLAEIGEESVPGPAARTDSVTYDN